MGDDDVSQLHAISGGALDLDQCRLFIRNCNGDLNAAINKFFDNDMTPLSAPTWDQKAWEADRYGGNENPDVPSPYLAEYNRTESCTAAPSRPPSRTSNQSMETLAHKDAIPSIETGQATGVTGRSQATFGPATRDDYDSSQWALVHTADLPRATTSESIPDIVSPSHCKRDDGPAILKPLPNADYLPALLVLLHGVPLARNIFMSPEVVADDYGDNADWWKGEVTNFRGTVSSGSVEDHSESERQFLYEVQRLMAFLDGTDRAYGSIEPLIYQGALLKHIGAGTPCGNELFRFLATWAAVAQRQTGVELDGVLRCIVEVNGVEEAPEWCLDASISTKHAQMGLTLYDVLDEHFFTGSNMAFLAKPSKVLLLKLSVTDDRQEPVNIKVPATLYADRYLAKNKDAVLSEYRDVRHHRDRLQEINHLTEKYRYSTRGEGDRYDGLALLRMTMQLYQPSESDSREAEKNARVVAQLQSVYDRVERKLKALDQEREKVEEMLQSFSQYLKGPVENVWASPSPTVTDDADPSEQPKSSQLTAPYKLCGVSTQTNMFYTLQRPRNKDVTEATWWGIEYCHDDVLEPYIRRAAPLNIKFVLQRAREEAADVFLVYASDEALQAPSVAAPRPLQDFVKRDNYRFMRSVQDETGYKTNIASAANAATAAARNGGVSVVGSWDAECEDRQAASRARRKGGDAVDALPDYADIAQYCIRSSPPLPPRNSTGKARITVEHLQQIQRQEFENPLVDDDSSASTVEVKLPDDEVEMADVGQSRASVKPAQPSSEPAYRQDEDGDVNMVDASLSRQPSQAAQRPPRSQSQPQSQSQSQAPSESQAQSQSQSQSQVRQSSYMDMDREL